MELRAILLTYLVTYNSVAVLLVCCMAAEHKCVDFQCKTSKRCIDRSQVCDLHNHCDDGSDESQEACDCMSLLHILSVTINGT